MMVQPVSMLHDCNEGLIGDGAANSVSFLELLVRVLGEAAPTRHLNLKLNVFVRPNDYDIDFTRDYPNMFLI